ncbi:MAG: DUF2905 domain-containing protein, partial [Woeseia sp.]
IFPWRNSMQRTLIIIGLVVILAGLFWPWLSQLPIGRLPGDIVIRKPGFTMYVPITSMLIVSALLSLVLWLFRN